MVCLSSSICIVRSWSSWAPGRQRRAAGAIGSLLALVEARAAFERSMALDKRGKVVLRVIDE
jgi:hypothetical protein